MTKEDEEQQRDARIRLRAGLVSLAVGTLLLGAKYLAYRLTGSTAILSDALESIVNVVAAIFAIGGLVFAGRPADRSHPYGHGKIEFFTAVFEGGMIAFAAVLIIYAAVLSLVTPVEVRQLDVGVLIIVAAGLVNAGLGWFLIRTGRRYHSLTLVADGKHVLSDFWTSAGIVVGLGLMLLTGYPIFDPLVAALVGVNLGLTGWRLVRHAAGGLLDEEDTALLERVIAAINASQGPGIIRVHFLRAIRAGRFTHVDAHLVLPEFWTVDRAHDTADAFEARVMNTLAFEGEIAFHIDPCARLYCAHCEIPDCPIRATPFVARSPMRLDEVVRDDLALQERIRRRNRARLHAGDPDTPVD